MVVFTLKMNYARSINYAWEQRTKILGVSNGRLLYREQYWVNHLETANSKYIPILLCNLPIMKQIDKSKIKSRKTFMET